jgi:hypothetical protein
MANKHKKYLFVCHRNEEEITIETKESVDTEITLAEGSNEDIDFKVIGRICTDGLTLDFTPDRIEWYDKQYATSKPLVDDAVVKIIQKFVNGTIHA